MPRTVAEIREARRASLMKALRKAGDTFILESEFAEADLDDYIQDRIDEGNLSNEHAHIVRHEIRTWITRLRM